MSTAAASMEQRKLRSVARQYERDGYRITVPRREEDLPSFLQGFKPDFIAESEQDRVIVEIKRSDAVRGSNELEQLAERVSREPGWRFELVAISPIEQVIAPNAERMASFESRAQRVMNSGMNDAAYAYIWTIVEELLKVLALKHGIKMSKTPFARAVRDLVSRGVISYEIMNSLEHAQVVKSKLVHSGDDAAPTSSDLKALIALADDLYYATRMPSRQLRAVRP